MSRSKKPDYKYDRAKRIDATCRNHGSDPWSRGNRLKQTLTNRAKSEDQIKEYRSSGE